MLLASTNCVGAVWWECLIILAPLLFFWNPSRYERRAAFAQSTSFCTAGVPLRPIAPTTSPFTLMGNPPPPCFARSRIEQPCLFPLGRRYPSGFAVVVTRSKRESHVQRRAPGTCGARRDWSRGR